ncbi:alpha/beta hydrolase [Dyadobacter psychrophilus]|uniref:Acetyl esterase/lipase n=1 Tax=Dyadobacter psychrophilus TaxID=651661 RepID=A0A1T5H8H0_9BACT|nr:alpha/beta hydrolase [Dyadobacter psychrophilus]SKC16934.1 Acetyl esterase/lipase [Dyadobacter psychrophilus]
MTRPAAFSTMFGIRILLLVFWIFPAAAQTVMPLYPDRIPNAIAGPDEETNKDQVIRKVSKPTLTVFLPPAATANGSAVIVCPGGGYGVLVMEWEGYRIAKELNKSGIAAIILKYRLPDEKIMADKSIGPLQDAQQAIKTVRERSKEWKIDPGKIGIIGFSAGGHLAATAGTHYDSTFIDNPEKTSLRPDFMILVYPVISLMDKIGHKGSSSNLLGAAPTTEKVRYFSNELQVKKTTPPAFLTHAGDDTVVPVSNSIQFYEALIANGVPADMHIYSKGQHGYPKTPDLSEWFGRCLHWMQVNQFLPSK